MSRHVFFSFLSEWKERRAGEHIVSSVCGFFSSPYVPLISWNAKTPWLVAGPWICALLAHEKPTRGSLVDENEIGKNALGHAQRSRRDDRSERESTVIKDDADGHLIYETHDVLRKRCSWNQNDLFFAFFLFLFLSLVLFDIPVIPNLSRGNQFRRRHGCFQLTSKTVLYEETNARFSFPFFPSFGPDYRRDLGQPWRRHLRESRQVQGSENVSFRWQYEQWQPFHLQMTDEDLQLFHCLIFASTKFWTTNNLAFWSTRIMNL
jgi:hypothetical protein